MLKTFCAAALPAVAILAFAALALMYVIPAHAAPPVCGLASYYGPESGHRTANGEPFNGTSMTAASRGLPFGTRLRVTYRGKSVVVRINDRGPYVRGRFLDLSRAAAASLGMIPVGVARICAERIP